MTPQQLRNSILQQAIEGKLVEQRPEEGTAEELYAQIQDEKKKLIAEGKIKKEKPLPEITEEEIPFDIPDSWKWVRIGDLANYKKGPFGSALTKSIFVPKSEKTIKVYEQKNAIQKDVNLGSYYITSDYFEEKMKSFEVVSGDIIVSCAGTIGEIYRLPENIEKGIINQALMRIRLFEPTYCDYYELLFDYLIKDYSRKSSKGSAIKNIPPFDILKNYVLPLPPLEEQKRIVAKIEELLQFIDKYEKAYNALEEYNARFPEDMRKSILQQAIEGKLVEQRPEEGTAEELYAQIQEEKKRLIAEGKIKKEKPLPEISEDEIPFDIPESWKWVRLREILQDMADGPFGSNLKSEHYTSNREVRIIQLSNIGDFEWKDHNVKYTTYEHLATISRSEAFADDIVVAKMMPAGRAIIVPNVDKKYVLSSDAVRLAFCHDLIDKKWLMYTINSKTFNSQVCGETHGVTRIRTSLGKLQNYILPLPPIAEQKRIVAKIEELMPYCEKLK